MPNKMKYGDCTTEELVRFCTARGLTVETPSQPEPTTRQIRRTYFVALWHADANPGPFRFSALYPELRTKIYEELLVLNNSFTCHPQILAVSKQVNSEATNILYGDNLIEVKMWKDGVYVHGRLCGSYVKKTPVEVAWPAFLRRVQFLRFSHGAQGLGMEFLPSQSEQVNLELWGSLVSENVLHSLCTFLMEEHQVRSIKIDLRRTEHPNIDDSFDTYALHLLGPLKECVVEGNKGISSLESLPDNKSLIVANIDVAVYKTWSRYQLYNKKNKLARLATHGPVSKRLLAYCDMTQHLADQFSSLAELSAGLSQFAQELRMINEKTIYVRTHVQHHFKGMLHLEIQRRIALQAEGRRKFGA